MIYLILNVINKLMVAKNIMKMVVYCANKISSLFCEIKNAIKKLKIVKSIVS